MDGVITALRVAHAADPEDQGIGFHLARLLAEAGLYQEALPLLQSVLARSPSDVDVLDCLIDCTDHLGEETLAQAYRQMRSAFGAAQLDPVSAPESTPSIPRLPGEKPKLYVVGDTRGQAEVLTDDEERPIITLADVGGMEQVKRRLELSFLGPLRNPALMKAYGKDVGGGLLLYGPPGCGKTFVARALAGELRASFFSIGLADVLDMYLGESERRLHELFENARRKTPAVLFFDELDAIGQKRSQLRNSAMRSVVNQLLAEMDGIGADNRDLFVIGATNHPWDVDAGLKRPGRFDRTVAVFPPDEQARQAIIESQLRGKLVGNVNCADLARRTAGWSGADLSHLLDSAIEYVIAEGLQTGEFRELRHDDFARPLSELRATTREWFETAKNYAMFANDGGQYDELLDYIRANKL